MLERVDNRGIVAILPFTAHDFARGLAAIERKDVDAARQAQREVKQHIAAGRAAVGAAEATSRSQRVTENDIRIAEVMSLALDAALSFATGARAEGIELAREAGEAEDALVFDYGPPVTVKPAWELAGELLLASGKKDEAAEAFRRALKRYPNRRLSVEGLRRAEGE